MQQFSEASILKFLSDFQPNQHVGWGTEPDFTFEEFNNKPFQPFTRLEKISRCCDYLTQGKQQAAQRTQEEEFYTVGADKVNSKIQHKKTNKKPSNFYQPTQHIGNPSFRWDHTSHRRSKFTQSYKRVNVTKTKFKDSITIQADWLIQYEAQKSVIEKTPLSLPFYEELLTSGQVRVYKEIFDMTKPMNEKHIPNLLEDVVSSSTSEDGYLKALIDKNQGDEKIPTVYCTDKLLFAIMTLKYSVYPWDIFVTKRGNQIIFDKAQENKDRNTYLELQSINENTSGDMKEDEKTVLNDCEESTFASWNWLLSAVQDGKINEELSGEKQDNAHYSTQFAYKYVKCVVKERLDKGGRNEESKAGEEKFHVIIRTQVDGCDKDGNPLLIKSLNPCETSQNWRKSLEQSAGQLTSQVYMANTNTMAKWLCHAMVAQVDRIKIGFITRQQSKDQNKHSLLRVETYNLKDISSIIGFKTSECWQNLRYVVEYLQKQEDGKYVLMKPAYKIAFRVYKLEDSDHEQPEQDEQ